MNLRPARSASDCSRIAAVVNAFELEPITVATVKQWFEHKPPGRIAHRMVATNVSNEVIGYSVAVHETWWHDHHFYVWVGVDPQWRGQGLGLALYKDVQAFLQLRGAVQSKSEVRDDDPSSLHFAERNGFRLNRHQFTSRLDLKTFDETPYRNLIANLEDAGIRFFTLADLNDSQEARRKLFEINFATTLDIPGNEGTYMSFEEFEQRVCSANYYRPAGQLIAADGETWVGMAAVMLLPETQGAYNLMTGVIPSYRGRKIALALKLLAIRYASAQGAFYLSTNNDSLNAPMLAINKKLGYQPLPGKYVLQK